MADHIGQVKPSASASLILFRGDQEANNDKTFNDDRRSNPCIKCCGCALAILVIVAVTLIILSFTVYHVKAPTVKINSIAIDSIPTFANGTIRTGENATLHVGVWVKNPNAASFRFGNTTTTVFYGGEEVGEGRSAAGVARARRTVGMNLTVEISTAKMMESPGLVRDWGNKALTMESYTKIEGRVKIMDIVKENVVVKLNCTVMYNVSTQGIQRQDCKRDVNL